MRNMLTGFCMYNAVWTAIKGPYKFRVQMIGSSVENTPCLVHMSVCQYSAACAVAKLKVRCAVFHQGWNRREISKGLP